MDPSVEEQLDYGEEEYGGSQQKLQYQGSGGRIPALAEEEMMGEGDDYDDLYNDVNVGEGFLQSMQQQKAMAPAAGFGGDHPGLVGGGKLNVSTVRVGADGIEKSPSGSLPGQGYEDGRREFPEAYPGGVSKAPGVALQGNASLATIPARNNVDPKLAVESNLVSGYQESSVLRDTVPSMPTQPVMTTGNYVGSNDVVKPTNGPVDINGPTVLYVGELHWWTSDADLEDVMSQYGRVKEIKFFEERASGKSKGYCQVEFYDSSATAACKERMNGYIFNGRPCIVTYASTETLKQMGGSYTNRNQAQAQPQQQGRRQMNDGAGRGSGMNYQGGDGGRNFGRGGWTGRGGQGYQNRGQGGGGMRGRGAIGAKGMGGVTGGMGAGASGVPFAQGLGGPAFGGPAGGLLHPQGMMGAAFDPMYMGGAGPYGGFSGPAYPGMMPPYHTLGTVGLPGVAPHVNPAFFGRGMPGNGMSMMGGGTIEGRSSGMWSEGGWTGEEHGKKTRESSYGNDDGASDYGHGEVNHEKGGRSNASHEKERGSDRDWPANSDRRRRDEREPEWERSDRERYREEKDGYKEHRYKDRDYDYDDNRDIGNSSSRSRSKSGMMQEDDYRSRSRDADYGKRRRLPSE